MEKILNDLEESQPQQAVSVGSIAHKNFLSVEYNDTIHDILESSQQIKNKFQLFNWLQGSFQYLIRHEVLIFATRSVDQSHYYFDYLSCSRYFNDDVLKVLTARSNAILQTAFHAWAESKKPLFVVNPEVAAAHDYASMQLNETEFTSTELKEFVVHGLNDQSLMVIFGRLHHRSRDEVAANLKVLMPILQRVISSVVLNTDKYIKTSPYGLRTHSAKKLSRREVEVIQWLQLGKTNWEISAILEVSPLTIKNHVQNIIKKLGVQNRRQAAVKGLRLGLVKK